MTSDYIRQHFPSMENGIVSTRRQFLEKAGLGMGLLGLSGLLPASRLTGAETGGLQPDVPLHYPAKARHVIQIFLNGAPSHIDTFDPKPELSRLDGKPLPGGDGLAFGSPFKFSKMGKSGIEVSEVFPHLGKMVDEMTVIRSMYTDIPAHETATVFMNTGNLRLARPSLGSWVLYGLGSGNKNLPGFISLRDGGIPTGGTANWQAAFLPGRYQGTSVNTAQQDVKKIIENLRNQFLTLPDQRKQLDLVQKLNQMHNKALESDSHLEAEIASMEMAFRMQTEATDAFDFTKEPATIRALYGMDGADPGPTRPLRPGAGGNNRADASQMGRRLLLARRLVERGVRFVQVWAGGWDMHASLEQNMQQRAASVDQPIAGLLTDLKQRGLLDSTLVVVGGEFGRTPGRDRNGTGDTAGRDHNARGFFSLLAGGGVKGGYVHGATDDLGLAAAVDKVHVHDLHATILRLLGYDHTKLNYRYNGRDFRLTDVAGKVVQQIIA
jgi:Protein of unknown function (DUF1501)